MNDSAQLRPKLTKLKLSGILDNLEYHIEKAGNEKLGYSEFLMNLLQDEGERRDSKQFTIRLRKSGLEGTKTLENFDFTFNMKVHQPTIRELASCHYIEKVENLFFLGPSGVGKTHLAQAIGHEAVRKGYDVLFRNTHHLLKSMNSARGDGTYDRFFRNICLTEVLILDDFGLNDLNQVQQEDLYELICGRYGKRPVMITSNRDITEWQSIFSNPLLGSAAMDRLVDGAIKIVIEGNSYRVNNFIKKNRHEPLT